MSVAASPRRSRSLHTGGKGVKSSRSKSLDQLKEANVEVLRHYVRARGVMPSTPRKPNKFECLGLLFYYGMPKT